MVFSCTLQKNDYWQDESGFLLPEIACLGLRHTSKCSLGRPIKSWKPHEIRFLSLDMIFPGLLFLLRLSAQKTKVEQPHCSKLQAPWTCRDNNRGAICLKIWCPFNRRSFYKSEPHWPILGCDKYSHIHPEKNLQFHLATDFWQHRHTVELKSMNKIWAVFWQFRLHTTLLPKICFSMASRFMFAFEAPKS